MATLTLKNILSSNFPIKAEYAIAIEEAFTDEEFLKFTSPEGKNLVLNSHSCKVRIGTYLDNVKKINGLFLSIVSNDSLIIQKFNRSNHQSIQVINHHTFIKDPDEEDKARHFYMESAMGTTSDGTKYCKNMGRLLEFWNFSSCTKQIFARCKGETHTDSIVFSIDNLIEPKEIKSFLENNPHFLPIKEIEQPRLQRIYIELENDRIIDEMWRNEIPYTFCKKLFKACERNYKFLPQLMSDTGITFKMNKLYYNARMVFHYHEKNTDDTKTPEVMIRIFNTNTLASCKIGGNSYKINFDGDPKREGLFPTREQIHLLHGKEFYMNCPEASAPSDYSNKFLELDQQPIFFFDHCINHTVPFSISYDVKPLNSKQLKNLTDPFEGYPSLVPDSVRVLMGPIRDKDLEDEKLALLDKLGLLSL